MGQLLPPRQRGLQGFGLLHERPSGQSPKNSGQFFGHFRSVRIAEAKDAHWPPRPRTVQPDVHPAGLSLRSEQEKFDRIAVDEALLSVSGSNSHPDPDSLQPTSGQNHDHRVDQSEQLPLQRRIGRKVPIRCHRRGFEQPGKFLNFNFCLFVDEGPNSANWHVLLNETKVFSTDF